MGGFVASLDYLWCTGLKEQETARQKPLRFADLIRASWRRSAGDIEVLGLCESGRGRLPGELRNSGRSSITSCCVRTGWPTTASNARIWTGSAAASAPSSRAAASCPSSGACACPPTSARCAVRAATTGFAPPGCSWRARRRPGGGPSSSPPRCAASRSPKWPRWSQLEQSPADATALEEALFEAFRSHERVPGTAMQLHNIAGHRRDS